MNLVRQKQLLFVSGTNLLSSNLESRFQWKIHDGQKSFLKNKVVLLGCGWWQYQEGITPYTRKIYKSILHNGNLLHSVRDQYTLNKLKSIGIENIVNNKKYIGQTTKQVEVRLSRHFYDLHKNNHANQHIQNAFNKYGEDKFEFWILETCDKVKDTLIFIEQKYIVWYNKMD